MSVRTRLLQLAERRAKLTEKARLERESLATLVAHTDGVSDFAASAFAAGRRLMNELRAQPLIATALFALLVVLKPRRALGWAMKGWSAWRLVRGASLWLQRFAASGDAPAGR
jgi:hypothetical protein